MLRHPRHDRVGVAGLIRFEPAMHDATYLLGGLHAGESLAKRGESASELDLVERVGLVRTWSGESPSES